jgi:hypothetical protein
MCGVKMPPGEHPKTDGEFVEFSEYMAGVKANAESLERDAWAFVAVLEDFKAQLLERLRIYEEVENEAIRRGVLERGEGTD